MTKTTNYQLNQWDENDYVKREDFNADNAKIDAALQALAEGAAAKKLGEWTLDAAANQFSVPLTGIAPGEYARLRLFFTGKNCEEEYGLRVNGVTSGYRYSYTSGGSDNSGKAFVSLSSWDHCACWIDLYPTPVGVAMDCRGVIILSSGTSSNVGVFGYLGTVSYDQLESVQVVCKTTKNIGAGSKIVLYGLNC